MESANGVRIQIQAICICCLNSLGNSMNPDPDMKQKWLFPNISMISIRVDTL